jgi:ribosomal protein L15
MEIAESIGWVALGFLPVFGSMEVAWRLGKRGFFKPSTKETIMKKVSVDALHK